MKDILLTSKRQRTELFVFAICILLAFAMNVYAIIKFGTEWKELYTQLLWVIGIGVLLYLVSLVLRLIYWIIKNTILSKRTLKRE